ncbi:MAG: alpha/beta hydrolase [Sphingomonadaceae bacterium]|uniref:alpha/beta fold hydrolase n=1 Tax=Thermaurantiacus sp. TaxID=2820283 RepID=UPI00298F0EE3|nr:alpha/beta hydrolase [Thermaurantiacus sp.]MCS6986877.1 alpha/beta hydrolase [Sphingomonadaceae bacterium]MDW8415523.1 alpha/beta hydrolase [Thermaurantiacus sp.]
MTWIERRIPLAEGDVFALEHSGHGPTLLFLHATGMCAGVYRHLLAPATALFRVVAVDARGHGRTTLPADPSEPPTEWRIYRQDLTAVARRIAQGPLVLAGHSFGATTAFEAAVENPGLARAVLLLDPAFVPFGQVDAWRAAQAQGGAPNPLADQAARRRPRFPDRATAMAGWRGRGVFAGWPEEALAAYADGALLTDGEEVRLACAPAWEAASFRSVSTGLGEALRRPDAPPFILLAGGDGSTVPEADEARIRAWHPGTAVERFPGVGHFFPVTHPELVAPWWPRLRAMAA